MSEQCNICQGEHDDMVCPDLEGHAIDDELIEVSTGLAGEAFYFASSVVDLARRRLSAAEAIVAKLEKTADGVAITEGMRIWTELDGVIVDAVMHCDRPVAESGWKQECPSTLKNSVKIYPAQSYSTAEAAAAVKGNS